MVGFHSITGKTLLINDLDLVKQIFIKDFDHFVGKGGFTDLGTKSLNAMLFVLEGETWRETRHASTPVFTSGKLKKMSKLINKVANDLVVHLEKLSYTGKEVDARELAFKFTITTIANAGFGIAANAFEDCPQSQQFSKMAKKLTGSDRTYLETAKLLIGLFMPKLLRKVFGIEVFGDKESVDFFESIINQRLKMKTDKTKRNDMVDLFTETMIGDATKEEENEEVNGTTDSKVTKLSQMSADKQELLLKGNLFAMFFAGMDPPSAMMAACTYFLAKYPDMQERLFQEIQEANLNETPDYNVIMNLQYLEMFVQETMRHNPIVDPLRTCTKEYPVPGTNFTIPVGTAVTLSAYGIMMDERYFPNPTEFNPENFSPENKENRNPYTDLGFGIGARKCIGNRFALLQFKTGIVNMVQKFVILPTPRLPDKLELDPQSGSSKVKGGVWVKFEKR